MIGDPEKYRKVRTGSLLLAEPYGTDPYFRRSVILLTEHAEAGDVGFILNKPITLNLYDLVENFPRLEYSLCLGGPVHPATLHYLHTLGNILLPGAVHVTGNLYWGGPFEVLRQLAESNEVPPGSIRFFLGYAGWSAGQLQAEFMRGDWGVCPAAKADLLGCDPGLWYEVAEQCEDYRHWALVPENPSDN